MFQELIVVLLRKIKLVCSNSSEIIVVKQKGDDGRERKPLLGQELEVMLHFSVMFRLCSFSLKVINLIELSSGKKP